MIDHTGIASEKIAEARAFYDAIFAALGGGMLMEIPKEFTCDTVVLGDGREKKIRCSGCMQARRAPVAMSPFPQRTGRR